MPENHLAVHLYRLAAQDIRVGMEAVLIGTMTMESAGRVLDEYADRFPHQYERQRTLEKMWVIDREVTQARSKEESRLRKAAEERAKAEAKRGRR